MAKYSDYFGGGGRNNVPQYRHGKRANAPTSDESMSAWLSTPPPPDILDEQGNCRRLRETNPEVAEYFFLDRPSPKKDAIAKTYCEGCPVKAPCLAYAMTIPWASDFGIWGGTNRNQRMKMRPNMKGVKARERKPNE